MPATIDICVATYMRPTQLGRLLHSLSRLSKNDIEFNIIIVDNDVERSASTVVLEFRSQYRGKVVYDVQPIKNIALARNQAILQGKSPLIAMIDDDEEASEFWLQELVLTMQKYNADVVFGKVIPVFSMIKSKWPFFSDTFYKPDPKTGSTTGFVSYTTNCLIRRKAFSLVTNGFDPEFGRSGGEDTDFFHRLEQAGAKAVYSREAITFEDYSGRASLRWIIKRRFRIGVTGHRIFGNRNSLIELVARIIYCFSVAPLLAIGYFVAPAWFIRNVESAPYYLGILAHRVFKMDYLEYK